MTRSDMKRELEEELDAMGFKWPRAMARSYCLERLVDAVDQPFVVNMPKLSLSKLLADKLATDKLSKTIDADSRGADRRAREL